MTSARTALRVLPDLDDTVEISRAELARAVADVDTLADDLDSGIEATAATVWAGSRTATLNNLGRLSLRVQRLREDFEPLGGTPTPTRPRRLA